VPKAKVETLPASPTTEVLPEAESKQVAD